MKWQRSVHVVLVGAIAALAGCASSEPQRVLTLLPAAGVPAPAAQPAAFAPAAPAGGTVYASDAPSIAADSAIMIDAATGRTLFSKNPDERRPVASTQKLLTALVLLDECSLDAPVTVAATDTAVEPSRLNLRPGQTYGRRELLNAMMVKSSNDAAACLARTCAGSLYEFAARMNEKAYLLGATNSRFVNPHGLPAPGQYSTARDMARIAFVAYRQPVLRAMMRQKEYTFRFTDGRIARLEATNKLLGRSPIYTGMKTGYTAASGRCLVTSASLPGRDVILVQLGSDTRHIFDDADRLVHWQMNGRGAFAELSR